MSDADFDFEAEPLPVTGVGAEIVPVGKKAAGPRPCNEEGKCVVDDRSHFVPESKLPSSLEKHMVAKGWGGISSKFPP